MAELPYGASNFQEARWSLPLLRQLDWKRMQELIALLLHRAGFVAEINYIRPDASVVLTVVNPSRGGRLDALVQCPPWAKPNVDGSSLKDLYNSVLQEGASRGIFITSGEFTEDARQFAKMRPLELIDGISMLRTIERMPEEEQAYHLRLMTVGPYTIPTCPACGQKLELKDETDYDPAAQLKDLTYRDRQTVNSDVYARTLTIKSGAEVQFLKSVNVQELIVQGRATGNITVQGKLTVGKGGVLYGLVAARTINMEDGASLEAEARVLNANEIQPVRALPVQQVWRCSSWPKCRGQLPLR